MKVIIMLRRFEIDSSLFYPKTVMQFPTLSLGSLKGDKKRSKLEVRGWVGYNLPKYLLSERRNLVMNDFFSELDIKASSYQKCLSLSIPSLVREGCHLKKMFWFYNHKIKKWLLHDLGNTFLNRVWNKLIYEDLFYKSRVPFTWYTGNIED